MAKWNQTWQEASMSGPFNTKFPHFIPIGLQIWPPWAILVSDWLIFQKSSPLKPHGQMDPNFTGSIYGRSFTKFPHFIPIGLQIWLPRAILVSNWLIFQKPSPLKPHGQMEPTVQEASVGGPLQRFLISSQSDYKYGCHRQFLFLIGWYFKNLLLWNHMTKWNQTLH